MSNATQAEPRWWLCCWDHVFEHDPVPEGEELHCPESDLNGPCDTTLIYKAYRSRPEAEEALYRGATDWAPWVGLAN